MDYIEISFSLTPNKEEYRDALTAQLDLIGYESYMETDEGINAYIPQKDYDFEELSKLATDFQPAKLKFNENLIKDENWNESWEQNYFKPIIIGDKLLVRASFHKDFPKAEREIIIDPKTAFGTGYHATTYTLLEEILLLDLEQKSVLDMGTGTGILAILSKMKGSAFTLAVDNDMKSVNSTKENIISNNTPDISVKEGTTHILTNEIFDVIYENIWKNIVIDDLPILYKHLKPGGILLTSGFYEHDVPQVRRAAEKIGFTYIRHKSKDGWAVVKFKK